MGELGRSEDHRVRAALQLKLKDSITGLAQDIHALSRRLHPSILDELGLVAAIESECRSAAARGGAPVDLQTQGDFEPLSRQVQLTLYRVVQEGLRNVHKHARASRVSVELTREARGVHLALTDDGQGFERGAPGWSAGLGLASMEERVRLLGGRFELRSAKGQGTSIVIELEGEAHEEADRTAGG